MAEDIKTTWTADFSDVESAFESVQQSAQQSMDAVSQAAEKAANEIKQHSDKMKEETIGVGEAFKELKERIDQFAEVTGLALAYEGVKKLVEEVEQLGERATQMKVMSEVLGITTDQFQLLKVAAEQAGVGVEGLLRGGLRLDNMLTQARDHNAQAIEKLLALGITTDQVKDQNFGLFQAFQQLKVGLVDVTTREQVLSELRKELGPRSATLALAIEKLATSEKERKDTLEEANALSEDQIETLHAMAVEFKELGQWIENASSKVLVWASNFENALRGLASGDEFDHLGDSVHRLDEQFGLLDQKDWGDAAKQSAEAQTLLLNEMQEQELSNLRAGVQAYRSGSEEKIAALQRLRDAEAAVHGDDEVGTVKAIDNQIIAEKRAYHDQRAALAAKEADTVLAIRKNEITTEEAISRSRDAQGTSSSKGSLAGTLADIKQEEDAQLASIAVQRGQVDSLYKTKVISAQDAYQQTLALDKQEAETKLEAISNEMRAQAEFYNTQITQARATETSKEQAQLDTLNATLASLEEQKKAYADNATKVAELAAQEVRVRSTYNQQILLDRQQMEAQIVGLEEQAAAKKQALQGQSAKVLQAFNAAEAKDQEQLTQHLQAEWQKVTSAISSSLSSTLSGMLKGTQTFAQGMQNLFISLIDTLIQKFVDWAVQQVVNLFLVQSTTQTTAAAQIAANAAVAATAAASSVAAIPVYGWALAPEVAAETYADMMGYQALAAFAGGGEVPHDMLALVHKDEHVLPARFNQGLTNLVNSHAAGTSQQTSRAGKAIQLVVQAADNENIYLKRSDLMDAINELNARFAYNTA